MFHLLLREESSFSRPWDRFASVINFTPVCALYRTCGRKIEKYEKIVSHIFHLASREESSAITSTDVLKMFAHPVYGGEIHLVSSIEKESAVLTSRLGLFAFAFRCGVNFLRSFNVLPRRIAINES